MQIKLKNKRYPIVFVLPGLLIFSFFFVLPFFIALRYSFTNWNFQKSDFIGLNNYISILKNKHMSIAFKNTFLFTIITTFFKTVFGVMLAIILNQKIKLRNLYRTIFYLPAVINMIAVGIVFKALMHPGRGLINIVLKQIGLSSLTHQWLADPKIAIFSICFIEIWKWSGYIMLLILAALQTVPQDYYEAAEIAGANVWQKFYYITVPCIREQLVNSVIISLIGGLKVFDTVLATTGGGPGYSTQVFNSIIYKSYSMNLQGEACAGTVLLSLFILIITLFSYRTLTGRNKQ